MRKVATAPSNVRHSFIFPNAWLDRQENAQALSDKSVFYFAARES
jgi:hypothetical protein